MINPCDICILKVVCTEMCHEKENYMTLVKNAVFQNLGSYKVHKYLKMRKNNSEELKTILVRRYERKGG
jgi:hypothetical protein